MRDKEKWERPKRKGLPSLGLVSANENWTVQININPRRTCSWIFTLLYSEADLFSPIVPHLNLNLHLTPLSWTQSPTHTPFQLKNHQQGLSKIQSTNTKLQAVQGNQAKNKKHKNQNKPIIHQAQKMHKKVTFKSIIHEHGDDIWGGKWTYLDRKWRSFVGNAWKSHDENWTGKREKTEKAWWSV